MIIPTLIRQGDFARFNHVINYCVDVRISQKRTAFNSPRNILSANVAAVSLFYSAEVTAICMESRGNDLYLPPLSIYLTPTQSVTCHYFVLRLLLHEVIALCQIEPFGILSS